MTNEMPQLWCPDNITESPRPWQRFIIERRDGLQKPITKSTVNSFNKYLDSVLKEQYGAKIDHYIDANGHYCRNFVEFSDEGYVLFLLAYK